ncbi:MAG: pyridoxamine 5'-phosphate oxidase [Burkholderiales bacterium PBB5]|nr:MAG: pyridoxamine 5'-phosphate oxidase [Burkholderiales bacterium PBB5]
MSQRLNALPDIHAACWQQLVACAQDKTHAWRVMALASNAPGGLADVRSIVVREVNPATRTLLFFTDARSPKVAQLVAQPAASLLAWSAALGWQLRLQVLAEVQTSGLAVSSRWARLKMSPAAHDYLSPLPPGTPVAHPLPERGSRAHFAVVQLTVQGIDWLELHEDGHRRAVFPVDGPALWVQA